MTVIVCQMLGRSATAIPAVAASQIQMGPFRGMIWIMICKKWGVDKMCFRKVLVMFLVFCICGLRQGQTLGPGLRFRAMFWPVDPRRFGSKPKTFANSSKSLPCQKTIMIINKHVAESVVKIQNQPGFDGENTVETSLISNFRLTVEV